MTKLVTFLGRKPVPADRTPAAMPPPPPLPLEEEAVAAAPAEKTDMDVDQDLFFPVATQLGEENETVRNLLIDAEHKVGELEGVKNSISKLVEPVAKILRAYEDTKNENLTLQKALNSTRAAHNKLRDDLGTTEKRARTAETEGDRLRDVLSMAQQAIAAHEKTKAEHLAELTARRSHISELQRLTQQQATDLQQTREENRRLADRVAASDRRAVQLEGQMQAAAQKAMQATQERDALQEALDKAHTDLAQAARRLTESDKTRNAAVARFKSLESGLAEAQTDRSRLATALDEATQKHSDAISKQNSRFEALQARANLTEGLLEEARQSLMARADDIRSLERRIVEATTGQDDATERLTQLKTALAEREAQIAELEELLEALHEHNQVLSDSSAARDSAYGSAEAKLKEQANQIQLLEIQLTGARSANEIQLEQMNAQLQREQLERAMAEGALESGRRDIARLLREIGAMQHRPLKSAA